MIHHGDCLDVMAAMEPESVDAIVTDPPYGIGFMGKAWDALSADPVEASWDTRGRNTVATRDPDAATPGGRSTTRTGFADPNPRCGNCGRAINGRDTAKGFKVCHCETPTYAPTPNRSAQRSQAWHQQWAEAAYRVAKPSAYLLAFGGTRTVHRMTVALEDAGWIIRDMLVWAYASGFPKSKASLKPAWEPIVMARKPGPLRDLAIDACRLPVADDEPNRIDTESRGGTSRAFGGDGRTYKGPAEVGRGPTLQQGRWPANVILTDPIFDGGVEGVVGGGEVKAGIAVNRNLGGGSGGYGGWAASRTEDMGYGDSGTYSRFFLIPKANRSDREPVLRPEAVDGLADFLDLDDADRRTVLGLRPDLARRLGSVRANSHPTVKPTDLMRHLVRLVTPVGGTVLDPFLGSGTTALACELEGFPWIGIEREAEYVAIAEARLNGTQRGLGLVG